MKGLLWSKKRIIALVAVVLVAPTVAGLLVARDAWWGEWALDAVLVFIVLFAIIRGPQLHAITADSDDVAGTEEVPAEKARVSR